MVEFDELQFLKTYRGTEQFITGSIEYYNAFLELLKDEDMLEKIKFANDVLKIAPVKSFIWIRRDIFNKEMTKGEKQGLGACFGYLYKFVYKENYEAEQSWINDEITGIKTASYFKKK